MHYQFKPRKTFNQDLASLGQIDPTIIDDVRAAIAILLNGDSLPAEFRDHDLKRKYAGYREFYLRDTPLGTAPNAKNDVVVIYKVKDQDLVLIAIRIGSHNRLYRGAYHKSK